MREITTSGLFDNQLRQLSASAGYQKKPRRLFHDKPDKNPDYSLNNTVHATCITININLSYTVYICWLYHIFKY